MLIWPRGDAASQSARLEQLAALLAPHRGGPCAVGIRYAGEQASAALELGDAWRVRASRELLEALETALTPVGSPPFRQAINILMQVTNWQPDGTAKKAKKKSKRR